MAGTHDRCELPPGAVRLLVEDRCRAAGRVCALERAGGGRSSRRAIVSVDMSVFSGEASATLAFAR